MSLAHRSRGAAALVVMLAAGCYHALPPDRDVAVGSAAKAPVEDVPVRGSALWVKLRSGRRVRGELLSVREQSFLVARGTATQVIEWADVARVHVQFGRGVYTAVTTLDQLRAYTRYPMGVTSPVAASSTPTTTK